jgi:phospholipid transport system substrate-binding protein
VGVRRVAAALIVVGGLAGAAAACAAETPASTPAPADEASAFIEEVAHRVFILLQNASLTPAERETRLRALARQSFDVEGITRFLAGRAWHGATPEERQEFGALLEDYVMRVYASRVGLLERAPTLLVRGVRQEGNADVVASEFMGPNGGPPARADFRVVRKPDGELRVADVSVGGISLAITQRDEFAAVTERNGGTLAGLMRVIRQRIAEADSGRK